MAQYRKNKLKYIQILSLISSCVQRGKQYHDLARYFTDGHRFMLMFFDAIRSSVAHLYHSCLIFAPRTPLLDIYRARELHPEAKIIIGHQGQWTSLTRTVHVPDEVTVSNGAS